METTDKTTNVPSTNGPEVSESSADRTWDSEKYPSWQKSIGKEYWGNERLKDFGSMKDVMESIVNPKSKAPEKYDLGLSDEYSDVYENMRKADLTQDSAKAIADAFVKHMPKKYTNEALKDSYGADYEQAEKDFGKAVERILGNNDKMRKVFDEIKDNPAVFEFARIVGKNLGDSPNLDVGKQGVTKPKGNEDPFLDLLYGKK